jgi:hypothetical protein
MRSFHWEGVRMAYKYSGEGGRATRYFESKSNKIVQNTKDYTFWVVE